MSAGMIAGVALTQVEGEPRVRDIDLAERLGFERPRDIRKLIDRNMQKVLRYGLCATVARSTGGRSATEYWLNRRQMMVVCMAADTVNAIEVQDAMIVVFDAFVCGELVPRTLTVLERMMLAPKPIKWELTWPKSTRLAIANLHKDVKWDGKGNSPPCVADDIDYCYTLLTSPEFRARWRANWERLEKALSNIAY